MGWRATAPQALLVAALLASGFAGTSSADAVSTVSAPPATVTPLFASETGLAPPERNAGTFTAEASVLSSVTSPVTEISVPRSPVAAVFTPDSRYAWVLSWGAPALVRIELETAQTTTIPLSVQPFEGSMALTGDGRYIAVGGHTPLFPFPQSDQLLIVDPPQSAAIRIFDAVSGSAHGVIDLAATHIYRLIPLPDSSLVVALTASAVSLFDAATATMLRTIPTGARNGVLVDSDTLFVRSPAGDTVKRVVLSTESVATVDFNGTGFAPAATLLGADGENRNIFARACNASACETFVIDASTATVVRQLAGMRLDGGLTVQGNQSRAVVPGGIFPMRLLDRSTLTLSGDFVLAARSATYSPDGTMLVMRDSGGVPEGITWTSPRQYSLRLLETESMQEIARLTLSAGTFESSYASPVVISPNGEIVVAPNSATNTVSILRLPHASSIAIHAGDHQKVAPASSYEPLKVIAKNSAQAPLPGAIVKFRVVPGTAGASGRWPSGGETIFAISGDDGVAEASGLTATNSGTFQVVATHNGSGSLAFELEATSEPAPSNVSATATTATSVTITWQAPGLAPPYQIRRQSPGGTPQVIGESSTLTFTDNSVAPNSAYLYSVGNNGSWSAPDLATTFVFTDPTLAGKPMKAAHISELRTAVNLVRALSGLLPYSFTDPVLTGLPIRALHIQELRAAVNGARVSAGLPTVTWSSSTLTTGVTLIRAADVLELRAGVE